MSNKKLGNDFESEFCERLFEKGFWVHNMAQNVSGQPADVIAVKSGRAFLIDCKVCSRGKFPLERMEENQDLSMTLWEKCGNGDGWFALLLGGGEIYMIPHSVMVLYREEKSALTADEIRMVGLSFEAWL
jgi:Holliday junction resolvase